jgi:hypothetical protein
MSDASLSTTLLLASKPAARVCGPGLGVHKVAGFYRACAMIVLRMDT